MGTLIRLTRGASRLLLLAGALAAFGCSNPFEPSDPEPPDPNSFVEDFSTPDRLIRTLELAMANKGPSGRLGWLGAMADSSGPDTRAYYSFHDPRVLSEWSQSSPVPPPEPWDLDLEGRFYDHFVARYSDEYSMQFDEDNDSPTRIVDEIAGTALIHLRYIVTAATPNEPTIIAIGYVELYLVRYEDRWWVIRWEDRLDPLIGTSPVDETSYSLGYRRLDAMSS